MNNIIDLQGIGRVLVNYPKLGPSDWLFLAQETFRNRGPKWH